MIVRSLDEIIGTERYVSANDNSWVSRRLLLKKDGMGFSLHLTTTFAGTKIAMWYKHHLEAVYCIEGEGVLTENESGKTYIIKPGTVYALNNNDRHMLISKTDMTFVCVFNPPVTGQEKHDADGAYPPSDF